MAFDPQRYEREVLRPLRGRPGVQPQDLQLRYDVDPRLDRAALEDHLRQVRAYWNQRAGRLGHLAEMCQRLRSADEDLRRRPGVDLADPAWWRAQAANSEKDAAAAVARLAEDLRGSYGGLGTITQPQREKITRALPLTPRQVDEAVRQAGLRVVEPVELPVANTADRSLYRTLYAKLAEAGARTVVHLLHPTLTGRFRIASGFAADGVPGARLDDAVLTHRIKQAEVEADSPSLRARKTALGLVRTAVRDKGYDVRTVALIGILDELREGCADGLPQKILVSRAEELGVVQEDAVVLVASLLSVEGASAAPRGVAAVTDFLAQGRLRDARATLIAVASAEEGYAEVAQLVDAAEVELGRLLDEAGTALRADREQDAERFLRRAEAVASDDPTVVRMLDALPPSPPTDVTAAVEGAVVRLAWRHPGWRGATLRYRVVRAEDRLPVHSGDGDRVGDTSVQHVDDPGPPVARSLGYAVFASVDGEVWSRGSTVSVMVLPPVSRVRLKSRPDRVSGSWAAHPAATVRVRRTVGTPGAATDGVRVPTSGSGFSDNDVRVGVTYLYAVTATYRDATGREVAARPVVVPAVPGAAPVFVGQLTVTPAGTGLVTVEWPTTPGSADVRVRRCADPPPWDVGATVDVEDLAGYGEELTGELRTREGRTGFEVQAPWGHYVYVPFSVAGSEAVAGTPVSLGVTTPVSRLTVRRHAERAVLTWVWPAEATAADVRWDGPGGSWCREQSRSQYQDENGCWVPTGRHGGTCTVRALTVAANGTSWGPPVSVTVSPGGARLRYTLQRAPGLGGAVHRRRRVVVFHAEEDCHGVDVVVVAAAGVVMPLRPERGTEVGRCTGLTLAGGETATIEVEVPQTVARPCWLRCFVVPPDGATLIDPSVDVMKVP